VFPVQALTNIRTVMAFNGQSALTAKYRQMLRVPQQVAAKQGFLQGMTLGVVMGVLYCSYALALW
jgi:ATP-binding cassette subfamily B (MDR/TAP) protein 1